MGDHRRVIAEWSLTHGLPPPEGRVPPQLRRRPSGHLAPRPIPQAAAKQRTHTRFIQPNLRVDTFESGNRPFPVDDRT